MEEEEEKVAAMMEDRKKYNQTIQDLEEQYVVPFYVRLSKARTIQGSLLVNGDWGWGHGIGGVFYRKWDFFGDCKVL